MKDTELRVSLGAAGEVRSFAMASEMPPRSAGTRAMTNAPGSSRRSRL
jgi:hypothetical protein